MYAKTQGTHKLLSYLLACSTLSAGATSVASFHRVKNYLGMARLFTT